MIAETANFIKFALARGDSVASVHPESRLLYDYACSAMNKDEIQNCVKWKPLIQNIKGYNAVW